MNYNQALARARKILGKGAAIRESPHALKAEARAVERERAQRLREQQAELKVKLDALRERLLMDPEYVQLREEYAATREAADRASSLSYRYPISVGTVSAGPIPMFHITAEGDTLEETIVKLEEKRRA